MALKRIQADHDPVFHGWTWAIEDEDELARLVAHIALGQARHAAKILSRLGVRDSVTTAEMADEAVERLTIEEGADPWHRDGWLFQAISWIAAHNPDKHVATRAPHIIQAHKGFDGVQLELAKDGETIESILISEDKATDNPRAMIRDKVWPEIRALEAGAQSAELRQETTALLQQQAALFPTLDVDKAIENVIWKDARRYRVSITVGLHHATETGRMSLFKGFEDTALGGINRRRGETLYIKDARKWFESFNKRVIDHVRAFESAGAVTPDV